MSYMPYRDGWCCAQCGAREGANYRHKDDIGDIYLCQKCNVDYMAKLRAFNDRTWARYSPEDGEFYDDDD